MKFDRVAALVTGLGLPPKVRADLFAAMKADLQQNEVEIGGIDAAADDRLTPVAHLAIQSAKRLGCVVNASKGVTHDQFTAATQGRPPAERMATRHLLLQAGLIIPAN
jgi:hypothetical protein